MPSTRCQPHQFIAHRGYARYYPENTLLAVEKAIEAGAVNIEVDIQLSRDGIPVVYHDDSLARTSGQQGLVCEQDAVSLARLPAHNPGLFGEQFLDCPIPLLQALASLMQNYPEVHFFIELKEESIDRFTAVTCLQAIQSALHELQSQCTLISYDIDAVKMARQFGFTSTGIIFRDWASRHEIIASSQANIAYINHERIPAKAMIDTDCPVAVYEVDQAELAIELLARGIAHIETFAIGEMLDALC